MLLKNMQRSFMLAVIHSIVTDPEFHEKTRLGLEDIEAGRTVTYEELRAKYDARDKEK